MTYDARFALIDTDGDKRFPAIINGAFQIGKARDATPTSIEAFVHAILIDGSGGRFVCADKRKQGVLSFGGQGREAVAYQLDTQIAQKLGISSTGSR